MKIPPKTYDRRDLLKMFGGSALLLHPLLSSREGYAQSGVKKRLLIMHTPNGVLQEAFWPKGNASNYVLAGTTLEPLRDYKSDLNIVKNVWTSRPGIDAHMGGMINILTGGGVKANYLDKDKKFLPETGDSPATGPSIDQIYAKTLKTQTKINSLNLSVLPFYDVAGRYVSYNEQGQRQKTLQDPYSTYKQLFADYVGCGGAGLFPPDAVTKLKRQSMLDALMGDLTSAKNRVGLGAEEKQKLEDYMESIREIEKRLAETAQKDGEVCDILAGVRSDTKLKAESLNLPAYSKLMHDLIVVAFKLDLTRVITLSYSVAGKHGPTYLHLKANGAQIRSAHHQITHHTHDPDDWAAKLAAIDKWHAGEFASLIGRLKDIKEEGSNVLNNSIAVWTSEIADGYNHTPTNVPFVIAGSGGGTFKTENLIDRGKTKHHGLLLDILEGVGVKMNKIGDGGNNPARFLKKA